MGRMGVTRSGLANGRPACEKKAGFRRADPEALTLQYNPFLVPEALDLPGIILLETPVD